MLLSIVDCLLSIVYCLLSIVYCLLPIVYCLLSIVYCLLSIVYCVVAQSRQSKGFGSTPKGFHPPPTLGFRVGEECLGPMALGP